MKYLNNLLAMSLACGLMTFPVSGEEVADAEDDIVTEETETPESPSSVVVQVEEKNNHIQILNLPSRAIALEMTIVMERPLESWEEPLEYTPFLSIDDAFLEKINETCYVLMVVSGQNLNDSDNFHFGTLDLKDSEVLEITRIKAVDFLLSETIYSDIAFEIVPEFTEDLESEEDEDAQNESEPEDDGETDGESDSEEDSNDDDQSETEEESEDTRTQDERYEDILAQYHDIADHWAKERILFVIDRGYFAGMSETEFMPNETMTRGMFVTVLGNVDGMDKSLTYPSDFEDVAVGDWFYPYVGWALEKGVASGLGDGIFAPEQSVSREQMAVMLMQYINLTNIQLPPTTLSQTFADHDHISEWALASVYYMQSRGLLSGKENNLFDPQGQATRGEVATLLKNAVESLENPSVAEG